MRENDAKREIESTFFFSFFFASLLSLASLHKHNKTTTLTSHHFFFDSVSRPPLLPHRSFFKGREIGDTEERVFPLHLLHSKKMGFLTAHEHGKSKVRLGRTWRDAHTNAHHFVEWEVCVRLISPEMEKAYTNGDNAGMTTTDTTRNMVRVMYGYFFGSAVLSSLNFHRVRCVCELTRFFFLSSSLSLSLS